jgi:hypothetical protein
VFHKPPYAAGGIAADYQAKTSSIFTGVYFERQTLSFSCFMPRSLSQLLRHAAAYIGLPALLLTGPAALAQTAPSSTAQVGLNPYTGPRFAGGPDSLRAMLRRATKGASSTRTGQIIVHLKLNKDGRPNRCTALVPPDPAGAKLALSKEVRVVLEQLPDQLGTWQLGSEASNAQPGNSLFLPLCFGPSATAPLAYSDENPGFINLTDKNTTALQRAISFLQHQFRYPATDLRSQVQGTVYGYFEVSETGAIENRHVVGSLSPTIDDELQRVLNMLPDALTPPRQQGKPARVAYVVPVNLKIQ